MSGGEHAGDQEGGQYSLGPLLEESQPDAEGVIEVGINVAGNGRLEEHDVDVLVPSPRIDPGEPIELGVFVSSVGDIEETDLSIFYDDTAVLDLENPGIVRRNVVAGSTDESESTGATTGNADSSRPAADRASTRDDHDPVDAEGATGSGSQHIHSTTLREGPTAAGTPLEHRPLGGTEQDEPAYILELNTRESAPPGEYPVAVVFAYRSDDGIKRVRKRPRVRLRSWRERVRPWLLVVASAALVFVGLGVASLLL